MNIKRLNESNRIPLSIVLLYAVHATELIAIFQITNEPNNLCIPSSGHADTATISRIIVHTFEWRSVA